MLRRWAFSLVVAVAAVAAVPGAWMAGAGAAVPDQRVAGLWHLDSETLCPPEMSCTHHTLDSSGRGNDLDVVGSPSLVTGKFGNAFALGTDGALARAATPSLEPQRLTVLAWVRATAPGSNKYVVSQGFGPGCTGAASYALETDQNGGLLFYVWNGTDPLAAKSPDAGAGLWDGKWHAVAGRYDGSTVRLYVDGSEVGTGTPASSSISYSLGGPTNFLVGSACNKSQTSNPFHFPGAIDEVRLYNEALSSFQIQQLETAAGPGPPATPPDQLTAELTATPNPTCVGSAMHLDASGSSGPVPIVKYHVEYTEREGEVRLFHSPPLTNQTYVVIDGPQPRATTAFGWNIAVETGQYSQSWGAVFPITAGLRDPVDLELTVTDSKGATASTSRRIDFLNNDETQPRDPNCPPTEYGISDKVPYGNALKTIALGGGGSFLSADVPCQSKLSCPGALGAVAVAKFVHAATASKRAKRRRLLIAFKPFVIAPGSHLKVKAKLTKRARKLLHKRHRLRVTEILFFDSATRKGLHRSRTVTLKLKRRKH